MSDERAERASAIVGTRGNAKESGRGKYIEFEQDTSAKTQLITSFGLDADAAQGCHWKRYIADALREPLSLFERIGDSLASCHNQVDRPPPTIVIDGLAFDTANKKDYETLNSFVNVVTNVGTVVFLMTSEVATAEDLEKLIFKAKPLEGSFDQDGNRHGFPWTQEELTTLVMKYYPEFANKKHLFDGFGNSKLSFLKKGMKPYEALEAAHEKKKELKNA